MKKIKVTQNIIDAANLLLIKEGEETNTCVCFSPIALALNQQTDFTHWFTDGHEAICSSDEDGSPRRFALPEEVATFEEAWLNGENISPIEFEVEDKHVVLPMFL